MDAQAIRIVRTHVQYRNVWAAMSVDQRIPPWNAVSAFANCGRAVAHVRGSYVPILLQKSFWGDERKFSEPLMRFMRGDVRDHIVSSKINHEPP